MPRFPRIHFEGALYYILTQSEHRLDLFRDDSDKSYYLSLIDDYKKQYNFKLYSLALISGETHLLIELSSDFTISQIMHDINANYTKYYNREYKRKGHLFKERFKAILIEKEQYLLEMTRYIHRIALEEGPMVQLKDYKWSSYPCYIKAENQNQDICSNIERDEALNIFTQLSSRPGIDLYQGYVEEAGKEDLEIFKKKLYRTSIVGTKEFGKRVKEMLEKEAEGEKNKRMELASDKKVVNRWISVFAVLILLFLGINSFLLKSNQDLKHAIKEASLIKEGQFKERLITAKKGLKRDLEEKHRADQVSYRAMARRLELEQQKQKQAEEL